MSSEYLRSKFSALREYLTPVTHTSTFAETGEITPEEFVQAGDFLVYKFPTWQWAPSPSDKQKDFLPPDKQYIVTRHVPSYVRASDYELDSGAGTGSGGAADDEIADEIDEDGWTSTGGAKILERHCTPEEELEHSHSYKGMKESVDGSSNEPSPEPERPEVLDDDGYDDDDDYVNDIDELIDDEAEEEWEEQRRNSKNLDGEIANDPKKRSYDLYISYSTSYRVPKMYIVGFDSNGTPLPPERMFEDIASDYRHKTVTIEKAPFLSNTTAVSIHPCRHATVMRALMKMAARQETEKEEDESFVKEVSKLGLAETETKEPKESKEPKNDLVGDADDWEAVGENVPRSGISVDQYLIIFLKFMNSVTPGVEHDYTMDAL